jgi:hypothetical protein
MKHKPGDLFNKFHSKKKLASVGKGVGKVTKPIGIQGTAHLSQRDAYAKFLNMPKPMNSGAGWGGEPPVGTKYKKHKKGKKKVKKGGLRPASAVVKSEQNASHQFFKKKKSVAKKGGSSSATKTATSTKTSTVANPKGNITVTGGAGKGDTHVTIKKKKSEFSPVALPKHKCKKHKKMMCKHCK